MLTAGIGSAIFVYRTGDFGIPTGGGFCALANGFVCKGQATLTFDQPVTGLAFNAYFAGPGDQARISAFAGTALLRTVVVRRNGPIDLSVLQGVTQVTFTDESTPSGTGIAYADFQYTPQPPPPPPPPPEVTPVPLPSAGVMMLISIVLLTGRARFAGKRRVIQGDVRTGSGSRALTTGVGR